ncbi:transcription cofactor vestigial-like protein 1 [Spea bombifrons]|uniref:transcription cofactor vestigial-like protein 1 n=1 Tax=Spea bombifrons TaxID=233779 RepID=UPI002349CC56|nr:transcription cofactor vestigial-like protein 1 [Spea bombifrons]
MDDLKNHVEYSAKDQPVRTELGSRCVVFTYYQGDINSVVDEHFSRALRNTKDPQDLRTKNRVDDYVQKNMSSMPPGEMGWIKPYTSNPSSTMTPPVLTTLIPPSDHYPPSVFQTHAAPPDLYHYHHMSSPNQINSVYHHHHHHHHPTIPEFPVQGTGSDGKYGSLLSLLQHERYPVPVQEQMMKPDAITSTEAGPSEQESMNQRMNSQSGLHHQERRKDFFHPQERRKDIFYY